MRDTLVNVAHSQRRAFKKHFLNSVHCELGISDIPIHSIIMHEAAFKDAFKEIGFLEGGKLVKGHYVFSSPAGQEATLQQNSEVIGLRFISQKPRREVNITSHNIVVSDHSYNGFEAFSERLESYVSIVTKFLGSEWGIKKTGLRKINSILIEPVQSYAEICEIFNPVLFGSLRTGLVRAEALKISEETLVLEKMDKLCVLRNRLKALDRPNTYEANLDFDLVDKGTYNINQVIANVLPTLNELHFDLFIWAITDELLQSMEN